jgi:oligoendopeptidase F
MASPNEDIINELVAENPSTPPDALEALASATMFGDNIDHISIYNSVITNPNTSLKTLRKLSNQGDEKAKRVLEVRLSNGENKISKHEDPFNRNTSTKEAPLIKSGLEKLVDDKDLSEEERVALDREAIDLDIQSGRELYDRIKRMYRSPVSDGRVKVAAYSFTPKIFLRKLSQDKENYVREQVAKNPNTPVDILETLSKDEDT